MATLNRNNGLLILVTLASILYLWQRQSQVEKKYEAPSRAPQAFQASQPYHAIQAFKPLSLPKSFKPLSHLKPFKPPSLPKPFKPAKQLKQQKPLKPPKPLLTRT